MQQLTANRGLSIALLGAFVGLSLLLADVFFFNVLVSDIYLEAMITIALVVWNVVVSGCFFVLVKRFKDAKGTSRSLSA